ncbi:hypothetical protein [Erythrobacter sp.]|uniref:hypothetical protein n=1 Tax=Erythrobacter sp. TaxID=1042 RepID=UPI00311EA689
MLRNFLLNYDPFSTDPTPQRLLEFVKSNALTYQYLHAFPGTFIIKSRAEYPQMLNSYRGFLAGNYMLLTEVSPMMVGGHMHDWQWQWLNNPNPPLIENQS